MASQSNEKEAKIEDFSCGECAKRFNTQNNYLIHMKTKHSSPPPKPTNLEVGGTTEVRVKEQDQPSDRAPKPKKEAKEPPVKESKDGKEPRNLKGKGFEGYQQDLEDRVYAFLGELGEKHSDNVREVENVSEESDRMMGQANYLENNVVRTPFEQEFDVKTEIPSLTFSNTELNDMFARFQKDTLVLNEKLLEERDTWQPKVLLRELRDPMEIERYDEDEFSLINISNVVNNYPRKGLKLAYPQFSIFLLWLAKICKPLAWKEFYTLIGYTLWEYREFLNKQIGKERCVETWKTFVGQREKSEGVPYKYQIPKEIESRLTILDDDDAGTLVELYQKWVIFFGAI